MSMFKTFDARIKAAGEQDGLEPGQFEAIVSVFGNKDSYGDVVMPGAFKDTLADWKASGDPIPIYYSHRMDDPDYNIGYVQEAKEVKADELGYPHPAGLWVRGQLDADEVGTKAAKVYRLMKGRRITQFSFAYDVVEGGFAKRPLEVDGKATDTEEEFYALHRVKLYEVGPTPIGANQDTELLGVKRAAEHALRDVKAGRVLSAKNETAIRQAYDALGAVLASLSDDSGKNGGGTNTHADAAGGNTEDPATGNVEDHADESEPVDTKGTPALTQADAYLRIAALG